MKVLFLLLGLFFQTAPALSADSSDFELTRKTFLSIYAPLVKSESGLDLKINLDEENRNYFGGMSTDSTSMNILIGIDFDKEKGVTPDFYAFVLCHEVGHLLGGLPKKNIRGKGSLYSSEGQSDYYAALVCLKKIFSVLPPMSEIHVTKKMEEKCAGEMLCLRTANAGREFFTYLKVMYQEYGSEFSMPDMDTPEESGISAQYEYPSFQCRLDTIVAGALNLERPGCWYIK